MEFSDLIVEGIWTITAEVTVGLVLVMVIGVSRGIVFAESFVIRQASFPALAFTHSVPHYSHRRDRPRTGRSVVASRFVSAPKRFAKSSRNRNNSPLANGRKTIALRELR